MSWRGSRGLAFAGAVAMVAIACSGGGAGAPAERLAADQTLTIPIQQEVGTLDPADVSLGTDIPFVAEMQAGLYRFENNLRLAPALAASMPDVSRDGRTYTFHLRHNEHFWNGDPITSADVLYSWNRAVHHNGAYATVMSVIAGFDAAAADPGRSMSGLEAPDAWTVRAHLTQPAGYWVEELGLPVAAVVDRKAVEAGGESGWWATPATAVGAGAFRLTERTPGLSMVFEPVPHWWGGSTGALKRVRVQVGVSPSDMAGGFDSGEYDVVGFANQAPPAADLLRYRQSPAGRQRLTIYPAASTTWIGFNFVRGPFASRPGASPGEVTGGLKADPGRDGRRAFSMAIDRGLLAQSLCDQETACAAAGGGVLPRGFPGYLGDGRDANRFNRDQARSLYARWDPDHSKVAGLVYRYNSSALNDAVAQSLRSQWQANLGVDVALAPSDFPALVTERDAKQAVLFRGAWAADYDHPQDWFDNLWSCDAARVDQHGDEAYCNPALDALLARGRAEVDLRHAVPLYVRAGQILVDDSVDAVLFYGTQPYLTQPYVRGAGYSALYDYRWEGIRLLQHGASPS